MGERPTTEHNGYKIVFEDYKDEWECRGLNLSHTSLKKLKEKINAWDLQTRKVPSIEAIFFSYGSDTSIVNITSIADPKNVWVKHGKGKGRERSKESVAQLAHKTVENNTTITKAKAMLRKEKKIKKEANDLLLAIPRMTIEELREIAGQALDEEAK